MGLTYQGVLLAGSGGRGHESFAGSGSGRLSMDVDEGSEGTEQARGAARGNPAKRQRSNLGQPAPKVCPSLNVSPREVPSIKGHGPRLLPPVGQKDGKPLGGKIEFLITHQGLLVTPQILPILLCGCKWHPDEFVTEVELPAGGGACQGQYF